MSKAVETNTTAVATGVPMGGAGGIPMWQQEKKGGTCCGCCCDYRRAVVVLSIVGIVFGVLGLVGAVGGAPGGNGAAFSDDALQADIEGVVSQRSTATTVINVMSLVMNIVNLVGAVKYIWALTGAYCVWSLIQFVIGVIFNARLSKEVTDLIDADTLASEFNNATEREQFEEAYDGVDEAVKRVWRVFFTTTYVISAIFLALWVYPSVMLTREIQQGIMTAETYPREEKSCCCTEKK